MKRLLLLVALFACRDATAPQSKLPPPPPQSLPMTVDALVSANGDSLTFTLRWGHASHATSYKASVVASDPSTTGLPVAQEVTDTTIRFTAVNTTYDSLAFAATVTAWRGTLQAVDSSGNPVPAYVSWSYVRRPGPPGPIIVDSTSNLLASLDAAVSKLDLATGNWLHVDTLFIGETAQACAFMRFTSGVVAMRARDSTGCGAVYSARYSSTERAVPAFIQLWADSQCVAWTSLSPSIASVTSEVCA